MHRSKTLVSSWQLYDQREWSRASVSSAIQTHHHTVADGITLKSPRRRRKSECESVEDSYIHACDLATTSSIIGRTAALHLRLPLRLAQPDNITLPNNPHLLIPLLGLQSCAHRRASNDLSILRPKVLQHAAADSSHEVCQHAQSSLRRTAIFSAANKQTWSNDYGMFEADLFDGFLELAFHLQVTHHRRSIGGGCRHKYVRLRTGGFGAFGESQVQVIVDLLLGGERAGLSARSPQC
jgi:hypothetical protein